MGYNNNHAGMHMIYYNRRNSCEDLEYYDRLAEKVRKKEENTQRLQSTEKTAESKNHIAGNVCENSNIQPQKSNKKEWENQNRNKHQKERPGKTKIIDDMYFRNTIDWYANIYLLAFERKLDIYDDICECEYLCEQDIRMSEKYLNSLEPITVIDKTSVFLNLLADRMGCDVCEFIIPNNESRSKRVYRLLDKLEKTYCNSKSVTYAFEYSVEEDEEYICERLSLNQFMYLDLPVSDGKFPKCNMEYYFDKLTFEDEKQKPIYTFNVTTRVFHPYNNQCFNFMYGGAEIISETQGRLKDFFERTKKCFFENGGTEGIYTGRQ